MESQNIDVITLYLSQQFDWRKLQELLDLWIRKDKSVAVIGDMNVDFLDGKHKLITYMENNGFTQLVKEPTHIQGGLIDHIYINDILMLRKPFHSQQSVTYSDHDKIVLHVPLENK